MPALRLDGLAFGGDYNPEQWPRETWTEDVALMREAGVSLVSVGIFSWALLEPSEGRYEFGWLDDVLDLLHANGIAVDLATATASPPPWLARAHPETLPVDHDGRTLWPGARQAFCPSSPVFRERQVALVEQVAGRYGSHPALVMWHVSNELGCHNAHCYCDVSAEAFRRWLRDRYGGLDTLNQAWATSFWSQRYHDWAEILPPRLTPTFANPTQQLDFWRFSSDEQVASFTAERDVLRRITPDIPVTTNLMLPMFKPVDGFAIGAEMDLVSNDHYLRAEDPDNHIDLAMGADLTRGAAGGAPWLLMEHSTSAVNWQPRNIAKQPGQLRRNSLAHVARGSEGALFFQWRASRGGAEKFHSALVPHAGTDTKVWREVCRLGSDLAALREIRGSRVESQTAILFDWSAWWAADLDAHPTADLRYADVARGVHRALWRAGITADLVPPTADLSGYRLIVVPTLYLVDDAAAERLAAAAEDGAHVLITAFSGIVDEHDHVRLGGYPGAFRDLLGVRVEEFFPLRVGETVRLSDGATGRVWSELVHADAADVEATFLDGPVGGGPALTRRGTAWYLATVLEDQGLQALVARVAAAAGVQAVVPGMPPGVEAVRRRGADGAGYLFVINHTDTDAALTVGGHDLLTGVDRRPATVAAGDVIVLRESG